MDLKDERDELETTPETEEKPGVEQGGDEETRSATEEGVSTSAGTGDEVATPEPATEPLPADDYELEDEDQEYSRDEYEQMVEMYESTLKSIDEGEVVDGKVLGVVGQEVLVDIGFKSEGRVPLDEFAEPDEVKIGDPVRVLLEETEDQEGEVKISKKKADFLQVWDVIKKAHDEQGVVEGILKRRIKGGLKVDLFGVEAFLPGSQVALRRVPNLEELIGQKFQFKILKINKRRRNIVVSRRVVLEEERERKKTELLAELEPGQIREGIVKNITDFGAFVDLGGIDGLLHITDMSWGRIRHPSELVAIGDELTVKVLNFDKENERISLGLKQLAEYPWEDVETQFPVGAKVRGKVVSLTDYGAFVELKEGVEGLVHVSEMSWTQHVRHPSQILGIGDIVEVVVLSVNKAEEKISLSLKQVEPDPWLTLEEKYPVGSIVSGKVRNLTDFGAFVQLEEGMDGLVHISDMSWTRRIKHPSEVLKRGEKIEVQVLSIDKDRHRISLGIKQTQENPWPRLAQKYAVGVETKGRIVKIHKSGVVVELPEEVEGFVPISHLGIPNLSRADLCFEEDDEIPLEVIEISPENRRVVLSVKEYLDKHDEATLNEYLEAHQPRRKPAEEAEKSDEEEAEAAEGEGSERESGEEAPETTEALEPKQAEESEKPGEESGTRPEQPEKPEAGTDAEDSQVEASDEEAGDEKREKDQAPAETSEPKESEEETEAGEPGGTEPRPGEEEEKAEKPADSADPEEEKRE
jgi:small subunit ribosomal protein S1